MKKIKNTITNTDRLYGNVHVYSSDDILMFKTNAKKAKWYLNKNLAEKINISDEKYDIRLKFKPKGLGHSENYKLKDINTRNFYLSEKENICVVDGCSDYSLLTKHHIVPTMFMKHFPIELKSNNSHDVVLISVENHRRYEIEADKLKDMIAYSYDVPTLSEYSRKISSKNSYIGMANAILSPNVEMENKIYLCIKFRNRTGIVPTSENLLEYVKACKNEYRMTEYYGKLIVDKIQDYQDFVELWRGHFINIMKPKYMPYGWDVKNSIFYKKERV